MTFTELPNWLSFNIFFKPDTLIGDITQYQKWYFKFLKKELKPYLFEHKMDIKYIFFGDYLNTKPVDNIIINKFDLNKWIERLIELKNENKVSQSLYNQYQQLLRYIRLRFYINKNQRNLIVESFTEGLEKLDFILGYQLVEYNVVVDIGKRFSSNKEGWRGITLELERLKGFVRYWDGICRYILTIITDDFYLDFKNVDIMGILHLGFHSLGSRIPIQYCQNCGSLVYFMSNNPVRGTFKCKCGPFEETLPHL